MKKTLASCKRFIFFYYLLSSLVTLSFLIFIFVGQSTGNVYAALGIFTMMGSVIGLAFLITGFIGLRLFTYKIDNHEVICFESFHVFMIVDEQVVDKAWSSTFHPPVLSHKLGNKQLEYSHRRLKVNGEYVMPGKK